MFQTLNEYANLVNFGLLASIIAWLFLLTQKYERIVSEKYEAKMIAKDAQIDSLDNELLLTKTQLEYQKENATERLAKTQDDLVRTEKWFGREIQQLQNELSNALSVANIPKDNMILNLDTTKISDELKETLSQILTSFFDLERRVTEENETINDPKIYLEIANALWYSSRWLEAAENYRKYLVHDPENWEVHYMRGAALVNSRQGEKTNIEALHSYSEAVVYAPYDTNLSNDMFARLFAYRGAVAKRLYRLDEAESDLLLASKYASADYETYDIKYNLAAVYAMRCEKEKMLTLLRQLRSSEKRHVRYHLDSYFSEYADDPEFLQVLNQVS